VTTTITIHPGIQAPVPEKSFMFDFERVVVVINSIEAVRPGGNNMPVYEYECKKCSHRFEYMIFTSSDPSPQCPKCNTRQVKRLISSGSVRNNPLNSGYGGFPTKKY